MTEPSESSTAQLAPPADLQVRVQHVDSAEQRRAELRHGLLQAQALIAPKFFYDEQGSALYGAIVALDEYYPPRLEAAIFERYRAAIVAALPHESQWVYLGCGDSRKAWPWIDALALARYVGVDIAEPWLRAGLQATARRFPQVALCGVVTDFTRGLALQSVLDECPELPRVLFYPGSSIGNFEPSQAVQLLRAMRAHLRPQDRLLIAADGVKPEAPLVAAYDDALGVTAAFNRNVLRVANRELDADFALTAFEHRAIFNRRESRIEMHLVSRGAQTVRFGRDERRFERGEAIVTEYSYKYSAEAFAALLADAGFSSPAHWSDDARWYHVFVAAPSH